MFGQRQRARTAEASDPKQAETPAQSAELPAGYRQYYGLPVQLKAVTELLDNAPAPSLKPSSPGEPVSPSLRGAMEHSYGADLSSVRVHRGDEPRALGALAYAQGEQVVVRGDQDLSSRSGQELLGHEVAHVVQQRGGGVSAPQGKGAAVVHDASLEHQADRAAEAFMRGERAELGPAGAGTHCKFDFSSADSLTAIGEAVHNKPEWTKDLSSALVGIRELIGKYELLKMPEVDDQPGINLLQSIAGELGRQSQPLLERRNQLKDDSEEYKFLCEVIELLAKLRDSVNTEIYKFHEKQTLQSLQNEKGDYLWLQPPHGPDAFGKGMGWPEEGEKHELRIPEYDSMQLPKFPSQELALLVIGGGHGGVGSLFGESKDIEWWKNKVCEPMLKSGLTAKCIVVDACYGASMASAFVELCTNPDGLIIGNTVPGGVLMDPGTWKLVLQRLGSGSKDVTDIVGDKVKERGKEYPQATTYGVFDPGSGTLFVDDKLGSLGINGAKTGELTTNPAETLPGIARVQDEHGHKTLQLPKDQLEGLITDKPEKPQLGEEQQAPEILEIAQIIAGLDEELPVTAIYSTIARCHGDLEQAVNQIESGKKGFKQGLIANLASITSKSEELVGQTLIKHKWNFKTAMNDL